jgi:hypothetical protein
VHSRRLGATIEQVKAPGVHDFRGAEPRAHGLIKVFGFFGGPGLERFEEVLQGFGFTSQLGPLSWLTGLTEVGGSALILSV